MSAIVFTQMTREDVIRGTFCSLLHENIPGLRGYARALRGNVDDADDPMQDALLRASAAYQEFFTAAVETARAFGRLSPPHRQVLISIAVDGSSYQHVAKEIGRPIGTVRSRLSRARSELAQTLHEPDPSWRTRTTPLIIR